jgi:hypothetical protein
MNKDKECPKCGGEGIIEYQNGDEYCDCYAGDRRRDQDEAAGDMYTEWQIEDYFLNRKEKP